jgi:membrane-bound lytic murein transglycosylase B
MTDHRRTRFGVLAGVLALLLVIGGLALYALTRPPAPLDLQPVDVAAPPSPADEPSARTGHESHALPGAIPVVSSRWAATTATDSGIPEPAVRAYGVATLRLSADDPSCHLAWTTLAGIGWVESHQGTIGGRVLDADGRPDRPIHGVTLDGSGKVAEVPSTSGGYQRAAGPMQFIPSTWRQWGSDGDGDGVADPQDIDDAAYAAARYLCASGSDLATAAGWSAAIFSYNHAASYVQAVYDAATAYAARTS